MSIEGTRRSTSYQLKIRSTGLVELDGFTEADMSVILLVDRCLFVEKFGLLRDMLLN